MGRVRTMHYCSFCDVYVGRCPDGELVVVADEFFQDCRTGHGTWNDPSFEEVWNAMRWLRGANDYDNGSVWFEHDGIELFWWYKARGLKEVHDHSLWIELVSR